METNKQFKPIPLNYFKECKRCGLDFENRRFSKYCKRCRPLVVYENMRKSQNKYFQSIKGKVALKKARDKKKINNIYQSPVQHPQITKKEVVDSIVGNRSL